MISNRRKSLKVLGSIVALALVPLSGVAQYTFESKFGSSGTGEGQFDAPRGVAIDNSGQIVITESGNNRVQICSYAGSCTAFGSFGLLSGEFDRPRGVTVSSSGRIFIADRGKDEEHAARAEEEMGIRQGIRFLPSTSPFQVENTQG